MALLLCFCEGTQQPFSLYVLRKGQLCTCLMTMNPFMTLICLPPTGRGISDSKSGVPSHDPQGSERAIQFQEIALSMLNR